VYTLDPTDMDASVRSPPPVDAGSRCRIFLHCNRHSDRRIRHTAVPPDRLCHRCQIDAALPLLFGSPGSPPPPSTPCRASPGQRCHTFPG
jgi:hypothetical protein